MSIQIVVNQMASLFILIGVGYFCGKIQMLSKDGVMTLTKVVLNISTPSIILSSVLGDTGSITGSRTVYFLLLSLLAYVLFFLIGIPASRLLSRGQGSGVRGQETKDRVQETGVDGDGLARSVGANRGLYCSMIVFGNTGFMGIPMAVAIFGVDAMFYIAIFNIVFQMLVYSVGIVLISGQGKSINFKTALNAAFIASVVTMIIAFTGLRIPVIVADTIRLASGINTPCAMIAIGATLSRIPVKDVFVNWRLYPIAFLRIIAAPVITWLVFKQFVTDDLLLGIVVMMSAMPTAVAVPMISIKYGGDEKVASSGLFLSTLLSAVTVPIILYAFLL